MFYILSASTFDLNALLSKLVSILGVGAMGYLLKYLVDIKKVKFDEFKQHDTQTQWVERLIKVANTPDNDITQEHFLIVQSTLRPFRKKNIQRSIMERLRDFKGRKLKHDNLWNEFSNESIIFVEYNIKRDIVIQKKIHKNVCNDLRMIANVLLKIHWENGNIKKHPNKYDDILDEVIKELKNENIKAY